MIWDEFLRHFCFCDEEDSGLSDEEQGRKGAKNRPKHTRKRIHQAKKNFWRNSKQLLNLIYGLLPVKRVARQNGRLLSVEIY